MCIRDSSLSSGGKAGSLSIRFLTNPKMPLSGNTSPTVFNMPGAALDKNLPTLVSINFFFKLIILSI